MIFFQNKPIMNSSVLPTLNFLTDKRIDYNSIQNEEIISLIRNLNPTKASGSDGICGQMLLLCDNSLGFTPQNIYLPKYSEYFYIPRHAEACKCDSNI